MSEELNGFDGEMIDAEGASDTAAPKAQAKSAQAPMQSAQVIPAGSDNTVTLPSGQTIDSLDFDGRDLVIVLADGTRIVVPDGAIVVPQLVVDGEPIPPANVAALLIGNEPEPDVGGTPSSGGNFATDPGAIQSAFDLGDLLPYTELPQAVRLEEEIFPGFPDDSEPEVLIVTDDNPAGASDATTTVDEAGLPERSEEPEGAGEPEGTAEETDVELTSGTIVFVADDGLDSITLNGVEITTVGQTVAGDHGTLTITSINLETGEIGFDYRLDDNSIGDGFDDFEVIVTDADGDEATANLRVNIVDDAPIGIDDTGTVPEGSHDPITGNVLDNDISGADDFPADGGVTGFSNGNGSADPGGTLQGTYGVLTLNADGSYTYVRDVNTPGGVEETFDYAIVDQDGSTSGAVLTIVIEDGPAQITFVPEAGEGTVVNEAGLPERNDEPAGTGEIADNEPANDSDPSETTSATITFNSVDGLDNVSINGIPIDQGNLPQTIVSDNTGTLVIAGVTYDPLTGDGSVTYEYTLADNTSGDDTSVTFEISVTDLDGDTASDDLTITIVDDEPEALDDTGTQGEDENAPVTVDVFANDTSGADDVQPDEIAFVDGSLQGGGSVVYNGDGTFSYTPAPGEEGEVSFDYTITDGDGDVATATVTITLADDSEPTIDVEGDNDVNEAGLPARTGEPEGSDAASDSEIAEGVIAITTGGDTLASLTVNGQDVTGGGTIVTAKGELEISVTNGSYSYSYTLTDNTLSDPDSDVFTLEVTDSDGDTADTSLVIAIVDDTPSAQDDSADIGAGEYGPVGGSVLVNDTQGADGAVVTGYSGTGGSGAAGAVVQGTYGTLTIAADGTFSYTRDPGTPGGVTDTFNYVITDGDGDQANADLVITIADSPTTLDLPTLGEEGTQVDEAGVESPFPGSAAAGDSEITSGIFTYTAPDGPAVVTIDGVAVTTVGQTFTGSFGTLTVDSIADGSIGYTYELTTNTNGDATADGFAVVVTDQDGDSSSDTLEIAIVDDVPTASPDSDSVTEDGPLVASGNVITGVDIATPDANTTDGVADVQGADSATVTGVVAGTVTGPVSGDVGTNVPGSYGSISILADGSYVYTLNNADPIVQGLDETESLTDVFSYTLTDGDGDTSTTTVTVTINGADDPVVLTGFELQGAEQIVDEDDLPDGSSPDAGALTQSGTFNLTSVDGLATLTVDGTAIFGSGVTYPVVITGDYGTLSITGVSTTIGADGDVVAATVSYEYVLSDNTEDHLLAGEDDVTDSFAVEATDTDGSSDTNSLDILVVDDVPSANADSNSVSEGDSTTGNVLTDNADEFGADGPESVGGGVVGVRAAGGDTTSDAVGNVGVVINGLYGTLTLNGDGSYSYASTADAVTGDVVDVFVYTIEDGDGDLSTTTLTIDVANVTLAPDNNSETVNEAALDLVQDGDDLAPGTVTGSDPASTGETVTGQLAVAGTGVTYVLDSGSDTYGTLTLNPDGSYTYTLTSPFTTSPDADNGTNTEAGAESYGYTATDANGNSVTGTITIDIVDDVPTASIDASGLALGHDETFGTDGDASDVAGPLAIFAGVANPGDDPDVAGTVIGYALQTNALSSAATVLGADGAGSIIFSLAVSADGVDSGLDTTDGTDILLYKEGDLIVGRVGGSTGEAAFALATDGATGTVSLVQYLSIAHPTGGPASPDEAVSLTANTIQAVVTATDGDGDVSTASTDIGSLISFQDDGPAFTAPISDEQISNDPDAAMLTGSLNFDPGADGPGATMMIMADLTGITVGGSPLVGSQSGNVFTAYVDDNGNGTIDSGETTEAFTITVDPAAGATGEYVFDLKQPLDGEVTTVDIGSDGAFGVGPSQSVIVSRTDVSPVEDIVFVTGWEPVGSGGQFTNAELSDWLNGAIPDLDQRSDVNGSTAGFGLGNNNFNAGEFMRFDFGPLDDYDGAGSYTPPGGTDLQNSTFVTFSITNFGSGDVVSFVAHYTDGTTESFSLVGSGGNSTASLTINAPAGEFLAFVDAYSETGQVKLNLAEVGVTETNIDVDIPVSIQLTDGDGDEAMDDFVINVFDDAPDAQDDLTETIVVDQNINAAFVLDFSGSIDDRELNIQLEAVKDAAFELFESTTGAVEVRLIAFSNAAQDYPPVTSMAALASQLDALNEELGGNRPYGSTTNFTAAIEELMTDIGPTAWAPQADTSNQVFFLSDGNPNQQTGSGGNSLADATRADWIAFVADNDINVTAIGVGNGVDTARLQDVDVDGEGTPIEVDDFDSLAASLITAVLPPVSGNVLDNDVPALNGLELVSITVNGVEYVWDGATTITPSVGAAITGTSFTATTSFGGELTFEFTDGSWTYEPPSTSVPEIENFQYVVTDGDGDTDSAILRIDIEAVSSTSNFAKNDVVITNASSPITIAQSWLQANDQSGSTVTGIVSSDDATSVTYANPTITFTDNDSDGGYFVYSASNGTDSDNALVSVNREQSGENTLDGTSGGDILVGRDGQNDLLNGEGGADIMFGGTGNDEFDIDDGESLAVVGGSGDAGTVSGYDRIMDFSVADDFLDFQGTAVVASDTSGTNGTDSTLTIGGQTIKSYAITDGIITFDDSNTFSSALTLSGEGNLAAVVDFLQNNDIGASNSTVAFVVDGSTFLYFQDNSTPTPTSDSLVKLEGVVLTDLNAVFSAGAIAPVVLDLDGGGNAFSSLSAGIGYDYDGDGVKSKTAWVAAGSAILAFDANADGFVTDASEFVFGTDEMTDLEAVAARYDDNNDGVLDASDAAYESFGVWLDSNLDAVADEGEFVSLSDAGITSIDLTSDGLGYVDADGDVTVYGTASFTMEDGSTGAVSDAAFATGGDVSAEGAMMEALLVLADDNAVLPATAPLIAGDEIAGEAVSDALAGKIIDNLIDQFAGGAPNARTEVSEASTNELASLLSMDLSGQAMTFGSSLAEVSMDEGGELAVIHG